MKNRSSARSKACDISQSVKQKVWERDKQRCVVCGDFNASPNAHFIPRSKGGLGIEQNIITLCYSCHQNYDFGDAEMIEFYDEKIRNYLNNKYDDWDIAKLVYKKYDF